jgi:hypothetical protein
MRIVDDLAIAESTCFMNGRKQGRTVIAWWFHRMVGSQQHGGANVNAMEEVLLIDRFMLIDR